MPSPTAVTPFVQPRYNYFIYVLLALEFSRREDSDTDSVLTLEYAEGALTNQPPSAMAGMSRFLSCLRQRCSRSAL